jgi:DNA helicase IV
MEVRQGMLFICGKVMVTDHDTLEQIVIDWRAPIADLYYEGRLGEASYVCPGGEIKGDIKLKRQYFFDEEGLKEMCRRYKADTEDFQKIASIPRYRLETTSMLDNWISNGFVEGLMYALGQN